MSCGNVPGSNRKTHPKRKRRKHYDVAGYDRAIRHACNRAFPPPEGLTDAEIKQWRRDHRWSPNRPRHTFATQVRRDFGLEAAQGLLGHSTAHVTQVYAQRDCERAIATIRRIG